MSTELFLSPPHPLSQLPVLVPPPSPLPLSFSTKDFLLTFPPHAATVLRSHRRHISSHQRSFHSRRLIRSAAAFLPSGSDLTEAEVAKRVNDVCDTLLATLKPPPQQELILSIVVVTVLPAAAAPFTAAAGGESAHTCFVAHGRFTSAFPASVPLVTCLLHPTPERYLPQYKHSQWIRDRGPLESLKQSRECGELIMCEEPGGGAVAVGEGGDGGRVTEAREGLITNVLVEEGGVVRGCRQGGRLLGYFESILEHDSDNTTAGVTVDGLKTGRYDSVFITGSSVCIAAVSGVKWLADGGGGGSGSGGGSGPMCGQHSYSEASVRRAEAMRLRMLATLDRHLAEDERSRATNGI